MILFATVISSFIFTGPNNCYVGAVNATQYARDLKLLIEPNKK